MGTVFGPIGSGLGASFITITAILASYIICKPRVAILAELSSQSSRDLLWGVTQPQILLDPPPQGRVHFKLALLWATRSNLCLSMSGRVVPP